MSPAPSRPLAPWASGHYLNLAEKRVDPSTAYEPDAWARLCAIRASVDPDGLFLANHRRADGPPRGWPLSPEDVPVGRQHRRAPVSEPPGQPRHQRRDDQHRGQAGMTSARGGSR